jgi:hypothetical protein
MAAPPRVICFSPVGISACFDALYRYALDLAPDGAPPGMSLVERRRLALTACLPPDTVVAAAGTNANKAELQAVLARAGVSVEVPELGPGDLAGVSAVAYSFAWPAPMRAPPSDRPGVFCLYGPGKHNAFLTRVFTDAPTPDALVVYVHRTPDCDVTVAAVGLPPVLPPKLRTARTPDEIRCALVDLYDTIVAQTPMPDPPPLGTATLFDMDATSVFELPDVIGKALPGGRTVDHALHACRLFMNSAGGGVRAGTIMISKGFPMYNRAPVDLDLTSFANGYLVMIEVTRPGAPDTAPAPLAIAWVNPPPGTFM